MTLLKRHIFGVHSLQVSFFCFKIAHLKRSTSQVLGEGVKGRVGVAG